MLASGEVGLCGGFDAFEFFEGIWGRFRVQGFHGFSFKCLDGVFFATGILTYLIMAPCNALS